MKMGIEQPFQHQARKNSRQQSSHQPCDRAEREKFD
jgi:hypothetical protein